MTELTITPILRDGVPVLLLEGEIDACTADALEAALAERRDAPVIVDLSPLLFIDSTGLHALLEARGDDGAAAIVRVPQSNIARILSIVQASKVCPLFDDLAAAIRYVNQRDVNGRSRLR